MSVLGEVFGSLGSMSQLQLLLAFVACSAYVLAQGSLLSERARQYCWMVTATAAVCFAIESDDWTLAAMLMGFAVAGFGAFVLAVWATSRALGFGALRDAGALAEPVVSDSVFPTPPEPRARPAQPTGPAHFV